jgi:aminopeptidase YwaD
MKRLLAAMVAVAFGTTAFAQSQDPPLLPPAQGRTIGAEVSGSQALRTVEALSLHHRMRVSEGYRAAAELIRDRLSEYGLEEIEIISLPADGNIFYGTQRSRPAWNASFAELWEQRQEGARWTDSVRVASWAEQPISLAQDSVSGRAETELVDIGSGTSPADYEGKDLRGKLVLTSSQPEAVADLAVGEHSAAGIVSWAQNQRTAWWGEDESLVRWGHLETFGAHPTFAFMVSPAQARAWQRRIQAGEAVRLRAEVAAERTPGAYLIPTAVIPGRRRDQQIVYSCHLDHPSPGANDNASGCSGILEVARSLNRLIRDGRLPRPERTIRFIWPAEIEGTIALLNARPEFQTRTLATIHLDMIGGDTEITRSILRVEGSPPSLPSFVSDVGFAFADYVNAQSLAFASTGEAAMPLVDPQGSRRALQAEVGGFSEGSDHQVWAEGSYRIPVIYIADWPDRYIHTQRDLPGNLDPTKMRRAIFIAAASGFYLANLPNGRPPLGPVLTGSLQRAEETSRRVEAMIVDERSNAEVGRVWRQYLGHEEAVARSYERFGFTISDPRPILRARVAMTRAEASGPVYRRILREGPMNGFGYSWFDDRLGRAGLPRPRLLSRSADRGPSFGYEALNLVDGRRSVGEIRDILAATVGDAPEGEVAEYLDTLARLGVLEAVRR